MRRLYEMIHGHIQIAVLNRTYVLYLLLVLITIIIYINCIIIDIIIIIVENIHKS